jgi:predicted small integral membrane protein
MDDFLPLFGQSAVVAMEAAWLTVAVFDNIRYPHLNERGFARVLGMDLVKQQDPEVYADVSDRRIENPRMEKNLFRFLVAAEVIVSILLWLGALALLLAAFGLLDDDAANTLAHIGVLGFIAIWASLLVGGQWFWYRIGLAAAQQTHFFLTIWGIATLTYLSIGL